MVALADSGRAARDLIRARHPDVIVCDVGMPEEDGFSLIRRVRALTRRGLGSASAVVKHGPLSFDATGRVAYLNDQMVELSARELSLLEVLLQRAGRLVSKEQLVELLCAWGEEVSNNAIEVYIHRLRKKIEQGPVRIATVRGLGYCLEKIAA